MKLTRISAVALAVMLAGSLAACGQDQKAADSATATADAKIATATSAEEAGGMEALVKAAEAEGQLNIIACPHDWANYGEVIEGFKKKYPKITVNEANPNASSKEEIDAANTNKGTDKAPDVFDLGIGVATESVDMFAPYKVATWDDIPEGVKEKDGRFYADYTGVMSIGWNKTKYGDITSLDQLTDPKFAGTVALNGKPAESGAGFSGFLMTNLAAGGTLENLDPGLELFKKLKAAGTLTTVDVTNATIDSGQTGVVIDWNYLHLAHQDRLKKQGVEWEYKVFPGSELASYYNQAINKDAPHPAAARLYQEYLYSDEAQNLFLKGGALPARLEVMKTAGTVDKAALDKVPDLSKSPLTFSLDDSKRITEWLKENWDKALGN